MIKSPDLEELREQVRTEARAEGLLEGRLEGQVAALRTTVMRQGRQRFGKAPTAQAEGPAGGTRESGGPRASNRSFAGGLVVGRIACNARLVRPSRGRAEAGSGGNERLAKAL